MGVRTLVGIADGTTNAAAMYDSVTGRMIGPIFEADDAHEQIESFLNWMNSLTFMAYADVIGLEPSDLPDLDSPAHEASDVRRWPDSGLKKLIAYWKREHVAANGWLKEVTASA